MADHHAVLRSFVICAHRPPTRHVQHVLDGKRYGTSAAGASFWFRPLTAAISEVPIDDREQELLVRVRTADLQEVNVPGTVTLPVRTTRASPPSRVDFSVDLAERDLARAAAGAGRRHRSTAPPRRPSPRSAVRISNLVQALTGRPRRGCARGRWHSARPRTSGSPSVGIAVVGVRFNVLPARAGRRAGPADTGPRRHPAGGRQGDLRAAGPGRRARGGDRGERAGQPDRAGQAARSSSSPRRAPTPVGTAEDAATADAIAVRGRGQPGHRDRRRRGRTPSAPSARPPPTPSGRRMAAYNGVPRDVLRRHRPPRARRAPARTSSSWSSPPTCSTACSPS